MRKRLILLTGFIIVALAVAGCDGIPGGEVHDGQGELVLNIADRPVNEAEQIIVAVDEVQVNREGAAWEVINDFEEDGGEEEFDLLDLRFDKELLGQETVPAGEYTQIRLIVAAAEDEAAENNPPTAGKSRVVFDNEDGNGEEENIFIPSGMQTGLKIDYNFTVEENSLTELLLDVDVGDVMHRTGASDKIIMRPTAIDVINEEYTENLHGTVLAEADNEDDDNYAIDDQDVRIEAYADDEDDPVSSTIALAEDDEESDKEAGDFMLRGLEAGTYNLKAFVVDDDGEKNTEEYQSERVEDVEVNLEKENELEDDIILERSGN